MVAKEITSLNANKNYEKNRSIKKKVKTMTVKNEVTMAPSLSETPSQKFHSEPSLRFEKARLPPPGKSQGKKALIEIG